MKIRMCNVVADAVGVDGLISFWDFEESPGTARIARGQPTSVSLAVFDKKVSFLG
jgi:hypothetical protein